MSETISIDRLFADRSNRNKHSGRGRRAVKESLQEFGAGRSILLDSQNNIIAGNSTWEAALEAGIDDVIIVDSTGEKLVAVRRTDLNLKEKNGKARALSIIDNRASELGLSWDLTALAEDLRTGLTLPDSILTADEVSAMLAAQVESAALAADLERGEEFGGGIPQAAGANDAPAFKEFDANSFNGVEDTPAEVKFTVRLGELPAIEEQIDRICELNGWKPAEKGKALLVLAVLAEATEDDALRA